MTETQEQQAKERQLTDAEIIAIVEAVDDETGFFGETKKALNTTYIGAAQVTQQVKPRILAALRSQVQTETTPGRSLASYRPQHDEMAWLIERRSKSANPLYWSGFGCDAWTFNADGAVRFQRRVDAERVVEGFRFDAIVTEHVWTGRNCQ